jgi:hypothetical protein
LIDFKTGGTETLPVVLKALEPLRAAGKLTTFTGGTLTKRDVTVVGTGNTPLDGVKALATRDIFFDAPAGDLSASADWAPTLSPLASADFKSVLGWWFWNDLVCNTPIIMSHTAHERCSSLACPIVKSPNWLSLSPQRIQEVW